MRVKRLFIVTLLLTSMTAVASAEERTSLFDGKTLDGWEGNLDVFQVRDEAIVGGSLYHKVDRNEFLCTTDVFEDFELRLKVRVTGKGANGGVQFRSRRRPDHHEVIGYQADVGVGWWGKLYDESRRGRVLAEPDGKLDMENVVRGDDWNNYVIRCEGSRIQLWLNGVQTVDYVESDEDIARSGVIALQIHGGPPSVAMYKDIELRRLNP